MSGGCGMEGVQVQVQGALQKGIRAQPRSAWAISDHHLKVAGIMKWGKFHLLHKEGRMLAS